MREEGQCKLFFYKFYFYRRGCILGNIFHVSDEVVLDARSPFVVRDYTVGRVFIVFRRRS